MDAVICSRCKLPIAAAEARAEVQLDANRRRRPVVLCVECRRGLDWFLAEGPAELQPLEVLEPSGR